MMAMTVEEAALSRLLDLRGEAPSLECSWTSYDRTRDQPYEETETRGDAWLRRVWEALRLGGQGGGPVLPGHGLVPSCTLWGGQLYGTTALIWRGGLAVAYLHHGYTSGYRTTHHYLRVEWIEPGVPDQERRRRLHEERVARKLAREEAAAAERLHVDAVAHDDADDAHAAGREARRLQGATRGRALRRLAMAARYLRLVARAA